MARNINFRKMERQMGIKSHTNNKMINAYVDPKNAKQLDSNHYHRLINQKEVYVHQETGLIVVRTDKNKKIKIIDPYRCMEMKIIDGDKNTYPFIVFDSKIIAVHIIVAESYYKKQREQDEDVHHYNHNKKDYNFENLKIIKRTEHIKLHKMEG